MTRRGCGCCTTCNTREVSFKDSYYECTDLKVFHRRRMFSIEEVVTKYVWELDENGNRVEPTGNPVEVGRFTHDSIDKKWESKSREGFLKVGTTKVSRSLPQITERHYLTDDSGNRTHEILFSAKLSYDAIDNVKAVAGYDMSDAYDMGVVNEHGFRRVKSISLVSSRYSNKFKREHRSTVGEYDNLDTIESKFEDPEYGKIGDGVYTPYPEAEYSMSSSNQVTGVEIGGLSEIEGMPETEEEFDAIHSQAPQTLDSIREYGEDESWGPDNPTSLAESGLNITPLEMDSAPDGSVYVTLAPSDDDEKSWLSVGGIVEIECNDVRVVPQYKKEPIIAGEYEGSWDDSVSDFPYKPQPVGHGSSTYAHDTPLYSAIERYYIPPYYRTKENWRSSGWVRTGLDSYRSSKPIKVDNKIFFGELLDRDFFSKTEAELAFGGRENRFEMDLIDPATGEVVFSQSYEAETISHNETGRPHTELFNGIECANIEIAPWWTPYTASSTNAGNYPVGLIAGDFDHSKHFPDLVDISKDESDLWPTTFGEKSNIYVSVPEKVLSEFSSIPSHWGYDDVASNAITSAGTRSVSGDGTMNILCGYEQVRTRTDPIAGEIHDFFIVDRRYEPLRVKDGSLIHVPVRLAAFDPWRAVRVGSDSGYYGEFNKIKSLIRRDNDPVFLNYDRVQQLEYRTWSYTEENDSIIDGMLGFSPLTRKGFLDVSEDVVGRVVMSSGSFGRFVSIDVSGPGTFLHSFYNRHLSDQYRMILTKNEEVLLRECFERSIPCIVDHLQRGIVSVFPQVERSRDTAQDLAEIHSLLSDPQMEEFRSEIENYDPSDRVPGDERLKIKSNTGRLASDTSGFLPAFLGAFARRNQGPMTLSIRDTYAAHSQWVDADQYTYQSKGRYDYWTERPFSYPDSILERDSFKGLIMEFRIISDDSVPHYLVIGGMNKKENTEEENQPCFQDPCGPYGPVEGILNYDLPEIEGPDGVTFADNWVSNYTNCGASFTTDSIEQLNGGDYGFLERKYSSIRRLAEYGPSGLNDINTGDVDATIRDQIVPVFANGSVVSDRDVIFVWGRSPGTEYNAYFDPGLSSWISNENFSLQEMYYYPGHFNNPQFFFGTDVDQTIEFTRISPGNDGINPCVYEWSVTTSAEPSPQSERYGFLVDVTDPNQSQTVTNGDANCSTISGPGMVFTGPRVFEYIAASYSGYPDDVITPGIAEGRRSVRRIAPNKVLAQDQTRSFVNPHITAGPAPVELGVSVSYLDGKLTTQLNVYTLKLVTLGRFENPNLLARFDIFPVLTSEANDPEDIQPLERPDTIYNEDGPNETRLVKYWSDGINYADYTVNPVDIEVTGGLTEEEIEFYAFQDSVVSSEAARLTGEQFESTNVYYGPAKLGEWVSGNWAPVNEQTVEYGTTRFLRVGDIVETSIALQLEWETEVDEDFDPVNPPEMTLEGADAEVLLDTEEISSSFTGTIITFDQSITDSIGDFGDGSNRDINNVDAFRGYTESVYESRNVDFSLPLTEESMISKVPHSKDDYRVTLKPREF